MMVHFFIQVTCLSCLPGKYQSERSLTECINCPANEFAADPSRKVPCLKCKSGRTSNPGATACSPCQSGRFSTPNGECEACPIGFSQPNQDSPSCVLCPLGMRSPVGSAACLLCDLGMWGKSPGFCTTCIIGKYMDDKGQTLCKDCRLDRYGVPLGDNKGAVSSAECEACPIGRTTGGLTGMVGSSACLCRAGGINENGDFLTGFFSKPSNGTGSSVGEQVFSDECVACPNGELIFFVYELNEYFFIFFQNSHFFFSFFFFF